MTMHREIITDLSKVREIEAAMEDRKTVSALAEVVVGEHPEHGHTLLVKDAAGKVTLFADRARLMD